MVKEKKHTLDYILYPESIAVIGASRDPMKWGHMILASIINGGYEGKVIPINPREKEIDGLPCFSSVKEVPGSVDLAMVIVPARFVPSVIQECADKGVKGAVIITSGFGETGPEGRKVQDQIVKLAQDGGVRLIGPNCMGICSSPSKLSALMLPFLHEKGEVAFISQSGGYGMQLYIRATSVGVGISKFISSGNEADLEMVDYLEYFGNDPEVKVIAMYLEQVRHGRRFFEVAKEVSKKKPIVVIKVGTTEAGSRAASSHTGALAGSDKIYDVAFKQSGVIRTYNAEEMFDAIKAFLYCPLPQGNQLGVIANSGGICVETTDKAVENGLSTPTLPEEAQQEVLKHIPDFGNPKNPVDLTASLDMGSFLNVPKVVLARDEINGLITLGLSTSIMQAMFPGTPKETFLEIFKGLNSQLVKTWKDSGKPVLVIVPGADFEPEAAQILEDNRIPVYTTPERAAKAFAALYRYKNYLEVTKA
jgi:acetyl-CoA synthetase (ADP-forming)